jgi:hypothetical protein
VGGKRINPPAENTMEDALDANVKGNIEGERFGVWPRDVPLQGDG